VGDGVREVVAQPRHVQHQLGHLAEEGLERSLDLGRLHLPAYHQGGEEFEDHGALLLALVHRQLQHLHHQLGAGVVGATQLPEGGHRVLAGGGHEELLDQDRGARCHPRAGRLGALLGLEQHRLFEGRRDEVLEGKPVSEGAQPLGRVGHVQGEVRQAHHRALHALGELHVLERPDREESLDQLECHAHRCLALLDRPVHHPLHHLVEEVGGLQVLHALHRLLHLAGLEVLVDQHRHRPLQLLRRALRPGAPDVHDERRRVLLHQALHLFEDFLDARGGGDEARRDQRDEHRGQDVVDGGAGDEAGQELGRVGRVERDVVDRPQHPDEPLEELLGAVELCHRREEHGGHLALVVLLLHRLHQKPLHHLLPAALGRQPQSRRLHLGEVGDGLLEVPGDEVLLHHPLDARLERGDREREPREPPHLLDDGRTRLASEGGDGGEERLGNHAVFEEVRQVLARALHLGRVGERGGREGLEERFDGRLHLVGREHPAHPERRHQRAHRVVEEGGLLVPPSLLALGHGHREDLGHQNRLVIRKAEVVDVHGALMPALVGEVPVQDQPGCRSNARLGIGSGHPDPELAAGMRRS